MKKIGSKIIFIIGFLIFVFPFAMRTLSYLNQTTAVYNYKSKTSNISQEELTKRQQASDEYNNKIADEKPIVNIGEEIEETSNSQSVFDFLKTGEVIGNLIIPKISVNLPIYEGIDNFNLEKGVAHLKDTSYPTGEVSTHCVMAGHSGLTRAKILDDLDQIEIGDNFQIEYLNNSTNYEVIDIQIVLPYETQSLQIRDGETLVTLVTCTPKSINTHRLLVTGKKVDLPQETITWQQQVINFIKVNYIYIIVLIIILITILIIFFVVLIKKKKRKRDKV